MFHTPPPAEQERSQLASQESYGVEVSPPADQNEVIPADTAVKEVDNISVTGSDNGSVKESEEDKIERSPSYYNKLPARLDKYVDQFIRALQEPRYTTPLVAEDISNLYQDFYGHFATKCDSYLQDSTSSHSKDYQAMETYQEIAEKKKERALRPAKKNQLLEDAEAKACIVVYPKIFKLSFCSNDIETNDFIQSRVKVLRQIPVTFKHLDLQIDEEGIYPSLGEAGQELHKMDTAETPKRKLEHLIKAHRVIVTALTDFLPKGSTSADSILPALIYTFIYFDTPSLWHNLQFINRYRNRRFLHGEHLYCLTNFEAAVAFLQSLKLETLGLTPEDVPKDVDITPLIVVKSDPLQEEIIKDIKPGEIKPGRERKDSRAKRLTTDIADTSLKTLGVTYRFLMGKLTHDNSKQQYPQTLEDARKVIGLDHGSPSSTPIERSRSEDSLNRTAVADQPNNALLGRLSNIGVIKSFRTFYDESANSSSTQLPVQAQIPAVKPPVDHLLSTKTADLKLKDVELLHSEYKRLVEYLKSINAFSS
ncbi:hypothetical protein TRVA0_043S00386 [Trichomonascus vanleenenianus]|uniref:VPS9 domain-containing protein n=1 Tax=Trichomonascus vanleenenianus TaxID=2268995 RepID=UPI003ECA27E0